MKKKQLKVASQILTPPERVILKLIAEGYRDEEIGDRLYISDKTVRETQNRIMRKLNAQNPLSLPYSKKILFGVKNNAYNPFLLRNPPSLS